MAMPDGRCAPAGIAPELCAAGFVADGAQGCAPVLPADPCPDGQMAVPGDAACHEVAPCGAGPWGDIPQEPATQYVDGSYGGGNSDGSAARPWVAIGDAIAAAAPGAIVAIAAGQYPQAEVLVIRDKPVRLWGRCPAKVEISTSIDQGSALGINQGADGSEVRSLSLTSAGGPGLFVTSALNVTVDSLWIHDTAGGAISVDGSFGPTSVSVSQTLVERYGGDGAWFYGAEGQVEASVFRDGQADRWGSFGAALSAVTSAGSDVALSFLIRGCLIERSANLGISVIGAAATVEATVIRDVLARYDGDCLGALHAAAGPAGDAPTSLTVRGSVIERSCGAGLLLSGAEGTMDSTVIRGTRADGANLPSALSLLPDLATSAAAAATVRDSLLEGNVGIGVSIFASQLTLERTIIRDTLPDASDQWGRGMDAESFPTVARPSTVVLRGCVLERNRGVGLFLAGSFGTVESTLVRDTQLDESGVHGVGIVAEDDELSGARSQLAVKGSSVEASRGIGILVMGSDSTLDDTRVWQSAPVGDGLFGDGVTLVYTGKPATATFTASRIEAAGRAGLSAFGAASSIGTTVFDCNVFDIDGESSFEGNSNPVTFDDRGGNVCGCAGTTVPCAVTSAGLAPPLPPAAPP